MARLAVSGRPRSAGSTSHRTRENLEKNSMAKVDAIMDSGPRRPVEKRQRYPATYAERGMKK